MNEKNMDISKIIDDLEDKEREYLRIYRDAWVVYRECTERCGNASDPEALALSVKLRKTWDDWHRYSKKLEKAEYALTQEYLALGIIK